MAAFADAVENPEFVFDLILVGLTIFVVYKLSQGGSSLATSISTWINNIGKPVVSPTQTVILPNGSQSTVMTDNGMGGYDYIDPSTGDVHSVTSNGKDVNLGGGVGAATQAVTSGALPTQPTNGGAGGTF